MQDRSKLKAAIIFVCTLSILGISAFFRIWHLANIPGMNGDEASYGVNSLDFIHGSTLIYALNMIWRRQSSQTADRLLFCGWLLSSILFFVIAGPFGFTPGNERYAICLILPGTLAVSRFILDFTLSRRSLRASALVSGLTAY